MKVLHPSLPFPGFQDEQFVGASVCFCQNEISFKCLSMQCTQHGFSHMGYIQYVSIWNEMKLPEWSQGTTSALPAGACASSWIPGFIFGQACDVFFSLHKSWLNAHMWRCINGGHVKTYKHVYIHILIYIYICIMDTRIYLRIYPTLRELSELLKPLQMVVQLLLPGFQDFALHKHLIQKIHVFHKSWINVCMWKALAKLQWPCRHTHKHIYVQIVKSMVNWLLS